MFSFTRIRSRSRPKTGRLQNTAKNSKGIYLTFYEIIYSLGGYELWPMHFINLTQYFFSASRQEKRKSIYLQSFEQFSESLFCISTICWSPKA